MQNLERIRFKLTTHKSEYAKKYGVKSLAIFGSYCRGEQLENSDVDIIEIRSQKYC